MKYWNAIPLKVRAVLVLVLVVLAALLMWRNWPQLMRLFKQDHGRGADQAPVDDARKAYLEALARRLYADINSSWWTPRDREAYTLVAQLNDNELDYLARFYEQTVGDGTPMGQDIDGEIAIGEDADRIVARLKTLALY